MSINLDFSKLENLSVKSDGWMAACPACRKNGFDSKGNHLSILRDGKYNCVVNAGDEKHNKDIYALIGINGSGEINNDYVVSFPEIIIEKIWPKESLDSLVKDYSYWNKRGISNNILEKFNCGVGVRGQMNGRFVFPIFNSNDEIIGFTGRDITGKSQIKWKHIGKTSKWIWGNLEEVEESETVILVESIGDALALMENGIMNVLCLFGVKISESILGYLISINPKKIIISTNKDIKHNVGQQAAEKIKNILFRFFEEDKVEIKLPSKKDFGEMTSEEIILWNNTSV